MVASSVGLPLLAAALLLRGAAAAAAPCAGGAGCGAAVELEEETSLLSVKEHTASGSPPCLKANMSGQRRFQACCDGLEWAEQNGTDYCVPLGTFPENGSLLSVKELGAAQERTASGSPPCLTPYMSGQSMFQACCGGLVWAARSDGTEYCVPYGTFPESGQGGQSGQTCQADGEICRDNAGRGPCCSGSCMGTDADCQAGQCTCTADPRVKVPVNGVCRYTVAVSGGESHANVYPCTDGTTCATQDFLGVGVCLP